MKTYVFGAHLQREEDGRWTSWIDLLPGCAAWGHSQEEALSALKDAAEAFIEDMVEAGEELPPTPLEVVEAPVVTITKWL